MSKSFFKVCGKPDTENWCEGYHPLGCVLSTDNAIESTNNIKIPYPMGLLTRIYGIIFSWTNLKGELICQF